jgi:putative peptide zinc metalloprotease protein
MSATADRRAATALEPEHEPSTTPARAEGLELLGPVAGSGYQDGAALVRRADGQMVQLGPLLYALLEEIDGRRDAHALSEAMCAKLGRGCDEQAVAAIADKLAEQGLLAGSEANAPERVNPLLALRWKVVASNPELTRRLTAPFTWLHRPWIVAPVLLGFLAVCWFVLVEKGVASAAAQAFDKPELILLIFVLGVASAAFHEIGHASACRYGGGTPGAMGAGIYLVWPAFYTDVTDAYRLPRGARLRTDLGGLYFNTIVAVLTLAAWSLTHVDALLLLIGLQLLEMVKQLSPVIRADGYHVLADATGVPDLYAHLVPTIKSLLPGQPKSTSALTGRARVLVTLWVLAIIPIMLSLSLGAILMLPRLATSTWVSGGAVLHAMNVAAHHGNVTVLLVGLLRLAALTLPVIGTVLITRRVLVGSGRMAMRWSRGRPARRALVVVLAAGIAGLALWAWWPRDQYRPIHASDRGTIGQVGTLVASQQPAPGPASAAHAAAPPAKLAPGTHLALSLIPEGGATKQQPAIFVITDPKSGVPVVIASDSTPDATDTSPTPTSTATAFNFDLPDKPGANDSQALAVNRTDGGITYSIAYSLVTVKDGADVNEQNGAYAFANCNACATVAVSFQVVLVVGQSNVIAPINIAEALNGNCPSCVTSAIARQIVISVSEQPSDELLQQLQAQLEKLDAIDDLGANTTLDAINQQVTDVQTSINQILADSGITPESAQTSTATADPSATPPADSTTSTTTDPPPSDTTTTPDSTSTTPTSTDPSTSTTSTTPTTTSTDPSTTTP